MEREKIVTLIERLLALSTSPNEAEATAALAKAQELLTKYNLDMATIRTNSNGAGAIDEMTLINEIVDCTESGAWVSILLNSIARNNYCHVVRSGSQLHILGRRANVQVVVAIHNWVEPQIIRLALASGYKRGDKTSYIYGIIGNIDKRLREGAVQYKCQHPGSTSLIVNIQAESDTWYKGQYPNARTRARSYSNGNAYTHGYRDGKDVSLHGNNRLAGGRLLLR